jgi:hypothetical protein
MATFTASTGITSGVNVSRLSNSNAVAYFSQNPTNPSIVYNSTNSGTSWNTRLTLTPSGNSISISSIAISGNNAILSGGTTVAGVTTGFLYYSTNGGTTWTLNSNATLNTALALIATTTVAISGNNAVIGIAYSAGTRTLLYSTDGGINWTASTVNIALTENIKKIVISGNNAVFITNQYFLYNSTDSGATWTQRIDNSSGAIVIRDVAISGNNVVIGEVGTLRNSTNAGIAWNTSSIANNTFTSVNVSGNNAVAVSVNSTANTTNLWNSINVNSGAGISWNNRLTITGSSTNGVISLSGNNAVASLIDGSSWDLYYSTNLDIAAATWTAGLTNISGLNSVSVSGDNAIASTINGVAYYTSTPLCYEKNTLILVQENEEEVYKKVSELNVGDLVKTYKHGYKKIKIIKSFKYKRWGKDNILNYLFRMKENGVILTAGHSLLVDELTEQEELIHSKYGFNQTIDDKKLLLAFASDKFEKIDDEEECELYHFSLENDDVHGHYGVYINDGILSESCSEAAMIRF